MGGWTWHVQTAKRKREREYLSRNERRWCKQQETTSLSLGRRMMLNMSSLSCFFRPHLRQHDASHIAATDTALFTPLMQVKSFRLFCVVIPSQSSSFFVGLVLKSSGAIMFRYSTVVHSSSWYNDRVSCSSRLATKACIFSLFSWWIDRIFPHFLLHSSCCLFSVLCNIRQPTDQ